jgi:lipoyl(octanoyl) transferase
MDGGVIEERIRAHGLSGGEAEVLAVCPLGSSDYDGSLALQEALREARGRGRVPDVLLLLEHPPVYTLGRGADARDLGAAAGGGVPVRRVNRGGKATFHGPGQLVGYAIVDLSRARLDVRTYVRAIETALIDTAEGAGIRAGRHPAQPGVWVGGRKLASIGVGIRRWITMHGFAINVTTDLAYFDAIIPCGLTGARVTSLATEGARPEMATVAARAGAALARALGRPRVVWLDDPSRLWRCQPRVAGMGA